MTLLSAISTILKMHSKDISCTSKEDFDKLQACHMDTVVIRVSLSLFLSFSISKSSPSFSLFWDLSEMKKRVTVLDLVFLGFVKSIFFSFFNVVGVSNNVFVYLIPLYLSRTWFPWKIWTPNPSHQFINLSCHFYHSLPLRPICNVIIDHF